jgi:hypothetical protein
MGMGDPRLGRGLGFIAFFFCLSPLFAADPETDFRDKLLNEAKGADLSFYLQAIRTVKESVPKAPPSEEGGYLAYLKTWISGVDAFYQVGAERFGFQDPHDALRELAGSLTRDPSRILSLVRVSDVTFYLQVLRAVRESLPKKPYAPQEVEDAKYLRSWIGVLDVLHQIGKEKFGFQLPHEELKNLAIQLTRNAATVINFYVDGKTDEKLLFTYFRWSEGYTRSFVTQRQAYYLKEVGNEKQEMFLWHQRLAQILKFMEALKNEGPVLGLAFGVDSVTFEDTKNALGWADGRVVGKLMEKNKTLADEELDEITKNCLSEPAVQTLLDRIEEMALSLEKGDRLVKIVEWALSLFNELKSFGPEVPYALRVQPGRILIISLKKALRAGHTFPKEIVRQILQMLTETNQLEDLSIRLVDIFRSRLASEKQIDFITELTTHLATGLSGDSFDGFDSFVQRTLIQKERRELAWEGSYALKINGAEGRLTLAFTGGETLAVGITKYSIRNAKDGVVFHFPRVYYNVKSKIFTATRDEKDESLRFKLEQKTDEKTGKIYNLIQGYLQPLTGSEQPFSGKQDFVLPKFSLVDEEGEWQALDGTFVGSNGQGDPLTLKLSEEGGVVSGKLFFRKYPGARPMPLPLSFVDTSKKVFYLTSGELANKRVYQIRGHLQTHGTVIQGYEMISGIGFTPVLFRKVGPSQKQFQ